MNSWNLPDRSPTRFCSTAVSSSRRFYASASPMSSAIGTDAARRSSRIPTSTWRWRGAQRTTPTCAQPAAACWYAVAFPVPTTSGSANRAKASFRRCAWCRAAPRKARRWRSITPHCNWWPTVPSLSAYTALSRAPTTRSARCWNSTPPMPACTCTRRCMR